MGQRLVGFRLVAFVGILLEK